tara:strand:+ start:358 stop:912 length:555 start_codon:yes stop_codon:yes gene_type:complete
MKKYFFLLLIIIGCEKINKTVTIDKLSVYRTSRDSTYFFKNEPFSGNVYEINDLGKKIRSFNVIEGKLNGTYEEFFANGDIKISIEMKFGIKNGQFKRFYENGNIKESMFYVNDLLSGKRISYWGNGLKKEENNFVSGALRGENIFYYSNGQVRRRIFFDLDGNQAGEWLEYDRNGKLKQNKKY